VPRKFQHGLGLVPLALFVLTVLTTTIWVGPQYSAVILLVLGAHEFGHYFACRWHDVDCTLPYFIPGPFLSLTGTLGAVIRIKEPFPTRNALFDIGVAGPIAGFVTLLPFLILGIQWSEVIVTFPGDYLITLGEPLLFQVLSRAVFGALPDGLDIIVHPVGYAAWFGMIATAINLLPFGQLDGGHILYAVLGPRSSGVFKLTLVAAVSLVFVSTSWLLMAVMLLVMAWRIGFHHPPPLDDWTPLSRGRRLVAALALLIFIACFTPAPITINF